MNWSQPLNRQWHRYGLAILCAALAIAARASFEPLVGARLPYMTFYPAIIVAALLGGSGPGVLTIVLCLVATFFGPSLNTINPGMPQTVIPPAWLYQSLFVVSGLPLAFFGGHARQVRLRQTEITRALSERSHEFEAAFEMTTACQAHLDPMTGRCLRANSRFRDLLGLTHDASNVTLEMAFVPEDRAASMRHIQDVASGAVPATEFSARVNCTGGTIAQMRVSLSGIATSDGRVRLVAVVLLDVTEQAAYERSLRQSESRFRGVTQAMPQLVWTCDSSGASTFTSDRWAAFTGQRDADSRGRGWLDAIHPDDQKDVLESWREAVENGYVYACPHRLRNAHGEYRRFLSRAVPVRGEDGEISYWIGTSTDIEDLKRSDDSVRRSEAMFRRLADANLVGVLIGSPTTGIEYINDQMLRMVGRDRESLVQEPGGAWTQWFAPECREQIFSSDIGHDGDRPQQAVECWFLRPDGERTPFVGASALLHPDSDTQIVVAQDLTVLKKTQETLRASEGLYQAIGESIDYGVWTCAADGRNTYASRSFLELVGLSQDECANLGWKNILHPDDAEDTINAWMQCVRTGGIWDREHRVRGVDGLWHAILARGIPVRDDAGRVRGWAGINLDISKLKDAERRTRESEMLLRRVLDGLFAFVGVLLPDGTLIEANRAPLEAGAVSAADVMGRKIWDTYWFGHSADEQVRLREACEMAAEGKPSRYEMTVRMAGDTRRIIDFMITPLRDSDGTITHLVPSGVDITDRKAMEVELRQATAVLSVVADTVPDFIYRKDRQGRMIYANRALSESLGLGPAGPLGMTDKDFLPNTSTAIKIMENDQRIMARGSSEVLEEVAGFVTGNRVFLSTKVAERDPAGNVIGLIGISRDITDRKRTQQLLEESERRYRAFTESVPTMLWAADAQGRTVDHNLRWEEYTGQSMMDGLGDGWLSVVHPEDSVRVQQAWSESVLSGKAYNIEYRIRRASDATYRWHSVQAMPTYDDAGQITNWFGTCVDIEARKQAESVLSRDRETLERLVSDRTRELEQTHQQLRFAERMAFIGTLSAGLGHDMGNLLVPVRVRLGSLMREPLSNEVRDDLEVIKTSLEYFQRLANGLRLLAIDPERAAANETTNLGVWMKDVLPLLKNVLPSGIRLETSLPELECDLKISRAALTQIAFNLVQNAGDAMRQRGSGHVRLAAVLEGDSLLLRVEDDGPGMSETVKRRCLEPFFSTKARGISTGLGLSLVFGLVQRAQGDLTLESTLGTGTTFLIRLPCAPRASDTPLRRAVVDVSDPRVRAFVHAELRALSFEVQDIERSGESVHLRVCEHVPRERKAGTALVVLSEDASAADGLDVVVVGTKPSPRLLRDTLRRLAKEPGPT